jgi:hypothetical protein
MEVYFCSYIPSLHGSPSSLLRPMRHIMVWWLACLGALSQRIHVHKFVDPYRPSKLLHCPILSPSISFLIPSLIEHFYQHFQLQEQQPTSKSNLHHNIIFQSTVTTQVKCKSVKQSDTTSEI